MRLPEPTLSTDNVSEEGNIQTVTGMIRETMATITIKMRAGTSAFWRVAAMAFTTWVLRSVMTAIPIIETPV